MDRQPLYFGLFILLAAGVAIITTQHHASPHAAAIILGAAMISMAIYFKPSNR